MTMAYLKKLIRVLSVTNPIFARKKVITGNSKAMPKPNRSFVKKPTYSPILGSAVKSLPPKFTKKANPKGITTK